LGRLECERRGRFGLAGMSWAGCVAGCWGYRVRVSALREVIRAMGCKGGSVVVNNVSRVGEAEVGVPYLRESLSIENGIENGIELHDGEDGYHAA